MRAQYMLLMPAPHAATREVIWPRKKAVDEDGSMRLTTFTDFSLRVLIFVALKGEQRATIPEISIAYGISRNHLMKVVHGLSRAGFLRTVKGRGGGIALAQPAETIRVGEVVLAMEDGFALVECFDREHNRCAITGSCVLRHALRDALAAFISELDKRTLADLVAPQALLRELGLAPALEH
jgi:Rrf2 family transcriptional regulator, nitric oxide-sensitive transcriptional repressor